MSVKRRFAKRRLDPVADFGAWRSILECGHDFFDDLTPFGLVEPACVWPPEARPEATRLFMDAAKKAWHRHGAMLMEDWRPDSVRQIPWAMEQFGAPPCR